MVEEEAGTDEVEGSHATGNAGVVMKESMAKEPWQDGTASCLRGH
jgi:hypothetical protein